MNRQRPYPSPQRRRRSRPREPSRVGWFVAIVVAGGVVGFRLQHRPAPPATSSVRVTVPSIVNPNFEAVDEAGTPVGWQLDTESAAQGYVIAADDHAPVHGQRSLRVDGTQRSGDHDEAAVAWVYQHVPAEAFRGRVVLLRGALKLERYRRRDEAQLWLVTRDASGENIDYVTMGQKPGAATADSVWNTFAVQTYVSPAAQELRFGVYLRGSGKAWVDDLELDVLGEVAPSRSLTDASLTALTAFARLLGPVRYFHPSDEVANTDWEAFTVNAVGRVESCEGTEELAAVLTELFAPVAPTFQIFAAAQPSPPRRRAEGSHYVVWEHHGLGTAKSGRLYTSERSTTAATVDWTVAEQFPRRCQPFVGTLGAGLACRVPLLVASDGVRTLPGPDPQVETPTTFVPLDTGLDRTTRLAAVILAWNALEHFYPYFDEVEVDWDAALRQALVSASEDGTELEFLDTLRRMLAALEDGHGRIAHSREVAYWVPPFCWDWVEGELLITEVFDGLPLEPGDRVLEIDGVGVEPSLAHAMAAASGATEAYRRRRALRSLWSGDENSPIRLVVTRGAQPPQAVVAERTRSPAQTQETRPAAIEEIEAGVLYLDVDRLEASDIPRIRSRIDGASGIVIDVRGYPRHNMFLVQGLMTQEADSPQWCVPVPVRPHQQDMEFEQQGWTLAATKRWRAKTVFLTDDRAISYAETYLSFVEQHQLAPIVGTTTAGTNGNINRLALPGGYEMVWTGMKTRKPDGSRHHGVGIQPTVVVERTRQGVLAGVDEVLEKGLALVRPPPSRTAATQAGVVVDAAAAAVWIKAQCRARDLNLPCVAAGGFQLSSRGVAGVVVAADTWAARRLGVTTEGPMLAVARPSVAVEAGREWELHCQVRDGVGGFLLDSEWYDSGDLTEWMQSWPDRDRRVILRARANTSLQHVVNGLLALYNGGVSNVLFAWAGASDERRVRELRRELFWLENDPAGDMVVVADATAPWSDVQGILMALVRRSWTRISLAVIDDTGEVRKLPIDLPDLGSVR